MVSTDEGIVDVTVKTKPGLSVAAVNDTVSQIENMVANDEEVDHYLLTYGSSGLSTMGGSSVTLSAYLKDDRKMSTDEVIDKWTRETENYKDISVTMEQGSTTSSSMSSTNQIEVDLQSTDYDALKKASDELVEELRKREDVMQVHSSIENAAPVIKVNVDPVLAQAEGLTPASIGSLIYSNLSGINSPCKR
jgi:multidrug efflux pump subunit AcrB